jgi:6-phosphofructokinase 1
MPHDIDTRIMQVGPAKIENPAIGPYVDDTPIPFYLDVEQGGEDMRGREGSPLHIEQAGPRRNIYYDPGKTKAAIVTCGGLCPGLNDVIRAVVLESHYGYGIRSIFGMLWTGRVYSQISP